MKRTVIVMTFSKDTIDCSNHLKLFDYKIYRKHKEICDFTNLPIFTKDHKEMYARWQALPPVYFPNL